MADRVNEILEGMVPELEDLRRRGLCTPQEVKALLRRREDAEYRINRRQPSRSDFLTAVELEINLESLLRVRRKRIGLPRRGASDYAVRKRVHFIFDRALRKFKADEELWLQWIGYSERTLARGRLSRTFARAIAMLPNSSALWIRAARWEIEGRQNLPGARSLLQRALRLNGTDGALWHAYFRLELLGLHRVHARREKLGLGGLLPGDKPDDDDEDDEEEEEEEEDDELFGDDGEEVVEAMDVSGADPGSGLMTGACDHGDAAGESLGVMAIPWLVFTNLLSAMGGDITVQVDCLRTCLDFPGTATCAARPMPHAPILRTADALAWLSHTHAPTHTYSCAHAHTRIHGLRPRTHTHS